MGGTFGKIFNPEIAGTGQTANDLSNIGYSQQDLATMDPKRALWTGALKGAVGGFNKSQGQGGQGGGYMLSPGPGPSPVDASYFAPSQIPQQQFGVNPLNSAIYGR